VEFFGLPVYDEVEPAAILAMTFPIIYGMMVGDVGYGLMSVVIALVILSKFKSGILNSVGKLWALAAIPTVLFGFFFDEWFGFSFQNFVAFFGVHVNGTFLSLFGIGLVLHRLEDISQLIVFTVMVGVLHLALGFLIGFFNEWHHNKTHAIAKLGWIGVLVSGLLLVPNLLFNAPFIPLAFDQVLVGAILFVVCVILIVRADGIIGLFEIPGVAGNAMSYARIAAVGIVGVVIAEKIINDLLVNGILAHTNNPIIFILVLAFVILLHFVNTFLAMFESLIQGARLNLVEFYGKFFHGGGRKFAPFAAARVYTKARPHSGPHEGHAKLGE